MGLLDIIEKNKEENGEETTTQQQKKVEEVKEIKVEDPYDAVKKKIHGRIILTLNRAGKATVDRDEMEKLLTEEVDKDEYNIPRVERKPIVKTLLDDILGYGPIQDLIDSDSCSEIMVNGPDHVYIEQKGKLVLTDIKFRDEEHLMNIIDRIVTQVGRHVDEASPMVDARLPDGSRVNAIIPPISLIGAVLTIRKFSSTPVTAAQLVEWGSLNPVMLSFLEACVKGKLNIVVSGGTGSGKTTLLNVLSSYIPEDERIVTIEDAAEVQLHQDHVITLECRPANLEGKGAITIRSLVKNALRMRPDRIIVGEVRSEETLDMLQAMNTGHDGSLTTTHANSPRDAMSRIETMVMMSGMELPVKAIRDQASSAIDVVSLQDIFVYETDGTLDSRGKFKGQFRATGVVPKCIEKIRGNGVVVKNEWFAN